MFQLDDNFLIDVGLAAMPADQKQPFLQHIYQELELRVGTKLSDGMSDAQLQEFEAVIDKKWDVIDPWVERYAPDYQADPIFTQLQQKTKLDANDPALKAEFTATKWLEVNRPNYRDVVAQVLENLKQEIRGNRDAILGTSAPQAA